MHKGACTLTHEFMDWREMYFDIQNKKRTWNIQDEAFFLRYKDGTVKYAHCTDDEDVIKAIDLRKVVYMVVESGDDAYDSDGKSWLFDFNKNDDAWNEYRDNKLYD